MVEQQPTPLTYLFIAAYDSMNQPMAALIPTLQQRGSHVIIVANNLYDRTNLSAFERCGVAPVEVDRFDTALLDEVDVVVMAPVRMYGLGKLIQEVRARGLFTVSFATLFSSVVMREYPDLVLSVGESKFESFTASGLNYNMVAVGNPQYDRLVRNRRAGGAPVERALVIDQGGYPYGPRGKRDLANTLIRIAQLNPAMQFYIKPRFYPQLKGRKTHEQTENLRDFMERRPRNINFLDKPAQLEELVQEFDAVITMWSTAHLDAALLNVPLILISGLESIDVFDVRLQRVKAAYKRLEKTGCVHDFRELQSHQVPFSYVNEEYLRQEVYDPRGLCAERACTTIELAYRRFSQGRLLPHTQFKLTYAQFLEQVDTIECEAADTPQGHARKRYLIELNRLVQQWVYTNRCLALPFDLSFLATFYDVSFVGQEEAELEQAIEEKLGEARLRWQREHDAYFSSPEVAMQARHDAILQDYYFDWLRAQGRSAELEDYAGPVLAPASLAYNRACIELERGNEEGAFAFLQEFLDEVARPHVNQLLKDRRALTLLKPFASREHRRACARFALRKGNLGKLLRLGRQMIGHHPLPRLVLYALRMRSELGG